jgi:hypothetical protein
MNVHGQGLRGTTRLIHYAFFPLSFLSLSFLAPVHSRHPGRLTSEARHHRPDHQRPLPPGSWHRPDALSLLAPTGVEEEAEFFS